MNDNRNALTAVLNEAGQMAAELTINFSDHGDTMEHAEFLRYLVDWTVAFKDEHQHLTEDGRVKLAEELRDRLSREIATAKAFHTGVWLSAHPNESTSPRALIEKLRESLRAAAD